MSDLGPREALVHLMVSMAAADGAISDHELRELGAILDTLPVFEGFDRTRLSAISERCSRILEQEDGLETIIDNLKSALPEKLYETAYALAIEVAASDVHASQPELRFLEILRDALELDRLTAGAIEHSARVRYRRL
ncbi:tellurite resistance TerB family protein [Aurantimonas sp. A2-1-M11]|uniref:tellurite resistance TerB family protein n=1 Tax=Aurantimonas sp. A2-1-M11 TaxID=3113712 RepID=UPI002F94207D